MSIASGVWATESDDVFNTMVEKVKKSDPSVDFAELRLAYTKTSDYSPYGGDIEVGDKMREAMDQNKYEDALKYAGMMLVNNYVDIETHMICSIAYKYLNDPDKEKYHKSIAYELLKSIAASGDGSTPETAFLVINTHEEYIFMRIAGLQPGEQSLIASDGHSYDKFEVTDRKTGEPSVLFFNVDIPLRWLNNQLQ